LRVAEELAVAMLGTGETPQQRALRARDRASGLALVSIPQESSLIPVGTWTPERLTQPRYFVAGDSTAAEVSFRPVFVSSLAPRESARWPAPIWTLPPSAEIAPGTFLFSTSAELVGVVVHDEVGRALVPGATVLSEAQRLLGAWQREPGSLGVEVQPLTKALAAVTGVSDGVVVSWVDPNGSAAAALRIGDVVEAVDDLATSTVQHWNAFVARVTAGQQVQLRVRRRHDVRSTTLIASAVVRPTPNGSLGLAMRERRGVGVEVIRVEPQSAGDRSGLLTGDLITLIGETEAPTPSQVARSYAALDDGGRVLIGVTRSRAHLVLVLER
jgi:S1-C subfamily serine protease